MKKILIACEESQAVTKEFRKEGFCAYSCDIIPCSGGHPEWHLQQDVIELLKEKWDMIIAFPPCTYLCVSGNRWFNIEKYGQQAIKRYQDREIAFEFFMKFIYADCEYIAVENPVGIMSTRYKKPSQYIQPYQFGDPYEKKTCLWLKNLPLLIPTNIVKPEIRIKYKSGKTMAPWFNIKSKDRSLIRSKTFFGIAKAMANQWSKVIK